MGSEERVLTLKEWNGFLNRLYYAIKSWLVECKQCNLRSVHVKKKQIWKTKFLTWFFFSSKFGFFFLKKKPNLQIWFFFISEKKTKFEFGLFLLWIWIFSEENCFWYISEVFSSEKIQIHKRKRPNSNLVFFF